MAEEYGFRWPYRWRHGFAWDWFLRPLCWFGWHSPMLWDEYERGGYVRKAYVCGRCGMPLYTEATKMDNADSGRVEAHHGEGNARGGV